MSIACAINTHQCFQHTESIPKQKVVSSLERYRARRFAESSARVATRHDASAAMALPTAPATPCRFARSFCRFTSSGYDITSCSVSRRSVRSWHAAVAVASQIAPAPHHQLTFWRSVSCFWASSLRSGHDGPAWHLLRKTPASATAPFVSYLHADS